MALNSELDDLLEDLGVDDGPTPAAKTTADTSGGSSALSKWRVKTRGLIMKKRREKQDDDDDDNGTSRGLLGALGNRKKSSKDVLGSGFSFRKLAGWSSPTRTNKADLQGVTDIIDSVIRSTRAELSTEAIMSAVSKELGQMFNPRTWTQWFNIKIEEAYERRTSPKQEQRKSTITKSAVGRVGRGQRSRGGFDEDSESDGDSEDDTPVRSRLGSPQSQNRKGSSRSPRRQIVDDDSESEEQEELASAPYSDFKVGTFCTVLPTADATAVSRDVRKLRKIKTQIWGSMQEKYGEHTGRIIGLNPDELLVKLQFPQADLWFAYEALDITENAQAIRRARDALRRANAPTPPSHGTRPRGSGASPKKPAAKPSSSTRGRLEQEDSDEEEEQDPDADSDDDMRRHFQETTEQVEEVTVTFEEGPLGMGFGWDGEYLEVFKFNQDAAGNKGQAERSESIMVGDLLVAVNDQPLSGLSKAEVIDILKTTPRPMNCTFRGIAGNE